MTDIKFGSLEEAENYANEVGAPPPSEEQASQEIPQEQKVITREELQQKAPVRTDTLSDSGLYEILDPEETTRFPSTALRGNAISEIVGEQQLRLQPSLDEIPKLPGGGSGSSYRGGEGEAEMGPQFDPALLSTIAQSSEFLPEQEIVEQTPNTLPAELPPGFTAIPPDSKQDAVYLMASSYPSMTGTGLVINPEERISYATSVMANPKLRSDVKAQIIDEAMRTGTVVPEALPEIWYRAQGLEVRPTQ